MECEYNRQENLNEASSNEGPTSILDLNEYCLLKVFDYLYIIDMINFGETCTQLQKVLRMAVTKFKEFNFSDYQRYVRSTERPPISVEKILSYVAPHIETLDMFGSVNRLWIPAPKENECNFKKLKSLTVSSSGILKWINAHNLETLDVHQLQRSDLTNFTHGMTKLKHLSILTLDEKISKCELLYFLERNPNIESLICRSEFLFKIEDAIAMLRNLKRVDCNVLDVLPNLMFLLQIEELAELKIEFNRTFNNTANRTFYLQNVNQFLINVGQKSTLKSLELRAMHFGDDRFIDSLSNLSSLRITRPRSEAHLCSKIGNTSFHSLTNLDISGFKMEVHEIFHLIENLKTLEQLMVHYLPKFSTETFLQRLRHFLNNVTTTRPMLELTNFFPQDDSVKIFFDPGRYEIIKETFGESSGYISYNDSSMFEPVCIKVSDFNLLDT